MSRKDPSRVLFLTLSAAQIAVLRRAAHRGSLGDAARRFIAAALERNDTGQTSADPVRRLAVQLPRNVRKSLERRARAEGNPVEALASRLVPED